MEFKQRSLFERKPEPKKTGYESIYQPNEWSARYVLINHDTGHKHDCKFYFEDRDEFIGQSLGDVYALNEHFDRSVITGKEIRCEKCTTIFHVPKNEVEAYLEKNGHLCSKCKPKEVA